MIEDAQCTLIEQTCSRLKMMTDEISVQRVSLNRTQFQDFHFAEYQDNS